jgi:hypothetical protein
MGPGAASPRPATVGHIHETARRLPVVTLGSNSVEKFLTDREGG